jgi:hypothetical protein
MMTEQTKTTNGDNNFKEINTQTTPELEYKVSATLQEEIDIRESILTATDYCAPNYMDIKTME